MKRKSFSLLEVLIGLVLIGILFGVLFDLLKDIAHFRDDFASIEKTIASHEGFRVRMSQIFYQLSPNFQEDDTHHFHTKKEDNKTSLCFVFNNEVDRELKLCDNIRAKIGLNSQGKLLLSLTSLDKKITREEELLEHVDKITWTFFKERWLPEYVNEKENPFMVKLNIKFKNKKIIDYAFFIGQETPYLLFKDQ